MIRSRLLFIAFVLFGCLLSVEGQTSGVRTEYMKDDKTTRVETNLLYVVNTPEQFVELQLRSWYKGEKLTSGATKVEIAFYSFSKSQLYKKDKDRVVVILGDGVETKVGTLTNTAFKGETENGIDTFFAVGGNENLGMQVPVPQSAQIKAGGSMTGVNMEMMDITIKPEMFLKLVRSSDFELRVGGIPIVLNDRHREILRNFTEQISPK